MRRRFCLLALLGLAMAAAFAQPVLRFSTRTDARMFEPVISAVYAELGYKVEFELLPAERGLISANDGILDGDIGRNVTSGVDILTPYPNLVLVNATVYESYDIAYALKGSAVVVGKIADLEKYQVGIVRGSKTAEDFVKRHGISAVAVESRSVLDQMVRSGRVDVAIGSSFVTPPEDLVVVNGALERLVAYNILNRKHAKLVPEAERVIKAMRADGRLAALLAKR